MKIKTIIFLVLGGLVIGFGGYAAFGDRDGEGVGVALAEYNSDKYGISFSYPEEYYLEEKDLSTPAREHFSIILTEDTEENRLVREGQAPGRDGPVAITFDFYQSPEDPTALSWVLGHSASNFKLGDGTYDETTLAGKQAVAYSWDGLYQADNVALFHKGYIISIAVTYIAPTDLIRSDFDEILETISFY